MATFGASAALMVMAALIAMLHSKCFVLMSSPFFNGFC